MPEKEIYSQGFRKRGVMDLDSVYAVPGKFLGSQGYNVIEKEVAFKGDERKTIYACKFKITHYIALKIDIELDSKAISKVEVKGKGSKNMVSLSGTIKGIVETDYEKKWEKGSWKQFVRKVNEKILIEPEIKSKIILLSKTCKALRKEFLAKMEAPHA